MAVETQSQSVSERFKVSEAGRQRSADFVELYRPERFQNPNPTAERNVEILHNFDDTLAKTAEIMAADFSEHYPDNSEEVKAAFRRVVEAQKAMVKPAAVTEGQDAPKSPLEYSDLVGDPKNIEAALAQHCGYVARELTKGSDAYRDKYDNVRWFLIQRKTLLKSQAEAAAELNQAFPGITTVEGLEYHVVKDEKDKLHVLINTPGYLAAQEVWRFARKDMKMDIPSLVSLFKKDQPELLEIMRGNDEKLKAVLRFAAMMAKTTWSVAALQRGIIKDQEKRYNPDKTNMNTFDGMVEKMGKAERSENDILIEQVKDLDQIDTTITVFIKELLASEEK